MIGCLRRDGFSIELAAQAFSVIDAYVYGFALTERNLPFDPDTSDQAVDFAATVMPALVDYPHLFELVQHLTGSGKYSFSNQFTRDSTSSSTNSGTACAQKQNAVTERTVDDPNGFNRRV